MDFEKTKLGEFDVTILDPRIVVFHNTLSDPKGLIKHYERNLPWRGWFGFGRQVDEKGPSLDNHPHFPSADEWKSTMIDGITDPVRREVAKTFHAATEQYVKYTKTELPNWTCRNWSLARYLPDENVINNEDLTMNYHTDYQVSTHDQPGDKFAVTAVIYPNDDYEGGEIAFRLSDDDWNLSKEISYKPKAGDIVIFPAEHPYYHGVKRIWNNPKYIIRIYWLYSSEGTPEWHSLREKYGTERFKELEQERVSRHDLMEAKPFLRPMFTITEYYEMLEAGTLPEPDRFDD